MAHLSFHGGVGTVTGSRHLLRDGETQVLVDAGLFQGLKQLRLMNWRPPAFDPKRLDALVLTHTHIDHVGYLPRLVRDGFKSPVYCTPGTAELAEIMLLDAAKIQEEDASYANEQGYSRHAPAQPLYETEDAKAALKLFRAIDYGRELELGALRVRFHNAGHLLGSAHVEVRLSDGKTVVFSGDVGRYGAPLHVDPTPLPACDALVVESTYGNRTHDHRPMSEQMLEPFARAIRRGGVIVVPAFAVGRAQQMVLVLRELMESGALPEVPIHIDSPMAVDATRIYGRHLNDHNLDEELVQEGKSALFPRNVRFHRSQVESKQLNQLGGPRIIISSSGMLAGGRVLHHLARRLPDPKNLLVLVGYQAAGTRGRALIEGAKSLRMHGRDVAVNAEFVNLGGLSGHADAGELMHWMTSGPSKPRLVFVTHGEPDAAAALGTRIGVELGARVIVPKQGDGFDLAQLLAT